MQILRASAMMIDPLVSSRGLFPLVNKLRWFWTGHWASDGSMGLRTTAMERWESGTMKSERVEKWWHVAHCTLSFLITWLLAFFSGYGTFDEIMECKNIVELEDVVHFIHSWEFNCSLCRELFRVFCLCILHFYEMRVNSKISRNFLLCFPSVFSNKITLLPLASSIMVHFVYLRINR